MVINENRVELSGQIIEEFEFSHESFHEKFYKSKLSIKRKSDIFDVIPIVVSEQLLDLSYSWCGEFVELTGRYQSWHRHITDSKSKLELYVFVESGNSVGHCDNKNYAELDGYIVKEPKYRKTPKGRDIADAILAVNRAYGKTDYIPLIIWGRQASYLSTLEVGTHIGIVGRIQSREYIKRFSETEYETRVAYEVSVQSVWEV